MMIYLKNYFCLILVLCLSNVSICKYYDICGQPNYEESHNEYPVKSVCSQTVFSTDGKVFEINKLV